MWLTFSDSFWLLLFVRAGELFRTPITHLAGIAAWCSHKCGPWQWFFPPGTQCGAVHSGLHIVGHLSRIPASGAFYSAAGRHTLPPRGSPGILVLYRNTPPGMGLWTQCKHTAMAYNDKNKIFVPIIILKFPADARYKLLQAMQLLLSGRKTTTGYFKYQRSWVPNKRNRDKVKKCLFYSICHIYAQNTVYK